ncbi:MAG: putative secreted protein [Pseudomonas sp.]|nr:putative secreted protein [Pseudomonas sp.]
MKALLMFLLAGVSAVSMAGEVQAQQSAVEQYSYSMKLDIAKVISMTDVSAVCGTTPVDMTYLDSSGQQHTVEYLVVGGGCNNG